MYCRSECHETIRSSYCAWKYETERLLSTMNNFMNTVLQLASEP